MSAAAPVLDLSSARIGVNVSPEEVQNLPVNGRNFANLMTLATGATSDGNGGWASVRFNGKSNQQNYLNYDGVDGTYVWDASPGYLNATGSQFRLQTSMESVAEFRVNSGLAPAESGLGAGGNITVISKSGSNRFSGSLFEYRRDDALDAANKYDDVKQPLKLNQFGGSIGGPLVSNKTFFFASYEGLRQKTGLTFTEAVPSDEARRRILAGEPIGIRRRAERGAHAGGRAAARRLPPRHDADGERAALAGARTRPKRRRTRTRCRCGSIIASRTRSRSTSATSSARAISTRRIGPPRPRRVRAEAEAAEPGVQPSVADRRQPGQRVQGRVQLAAHQRPRLRRDARLRSGRRLAVRHGHLLVDRRARHDRHRAEAACSSGHRAPRPRSARPSRRARCRSTTR